MIRTTPHNALASALVFLGCLTSCAQDDELTIPNRVLDRPMDMVLACISVDSNGKMRPLAVSDCEGTFSTGQLASCQLPDPIPSAGNAETGESESDTDASTVEPNSTPQLIGFVANSERNEVAMFSSCSNRLVDMDTDSPGYNFIPVGALPSRIVTTDDRCQMVTANYGSCDFSVLDVPPLAGYAFEIQPDDPPSTYVSRVVPVTGDGRVLASRPGDVISVPRDLTLGIGNDAPVDPDNPACTYDQPTSVIVTYPNCQLIAEVDLRSQLIVQSRQFITNDDGTVSVIDTGSSPVCPVDCPDQLPEGFIPPSGDGVLNGEYTSDGMFPNTLALISEADPNGGEDAAPVHVLHVGGSGSDTVFALPYREDGQWADEALEHELIGARGVSRIRPTPVMTLEGKFYQFLYVISGDGSTRVISRDLDDLDGTIGMECDTQFDHHEVGTDVDTVFCNEAPKISPDATVPDRRAFAEGPGIRVPFSGAVVTDWTFQTIPDENGTEDDIVFGVSPANITGVLGIGVTNAGTVTLVNFGHFRQRQITLLDSDKGGTIDDLGTMDLTIPTHSLWPQFDPALGNNRNFWPRMRDIPATRVISGELEGAGATKALAPAFRLIDKAYVGQGALGGFKQFDEDMAEADTDTDGGEVEEYGNIDKLGTLASVEDVPTALYETNVVRPIVRDYREWRGAEWSLQWEAPIPGTTSNNGRIYCDPDSLFFHEAYCAPQEDGDSMIIDSRANFCDDGVLPGDKVFVYGCGDDGDCGAGQVCLLDPDGGSTTGICVSQSRYDADYAKLLDACDEFISDPCGTPIREFLITKAFQDRLHLQVMDIPKTSFIAEWTEVEGEDGSMVSIPIEDEGRMLCAEVQPETGCVEHIDCEGIVEEGPEGEEIAFPYCIDGLCRRKCDEETEDCALRHLPGPYCYSELMTYQVHTRNSFTLSGPGQYAFIDERVKADENGMCYEDATMSELLTSRIRLEETFADNENSLWPIPDCPNDEIPSGSDPNPCVVTLPRLPDGGSASENGKSLFHYMSYEDTPVTALRFSNPMMSLVLDLTSLEGLTAEIPGRDNVFWPASFTEFKRSRIPRNYSQRFTTQAGYSPYNFPVQLLNVPLTSPVRVINAPEARVVYVVDSSGRGSTQGTRGQVLRVLIQDGQVLPDDTFEVR